MRLSDLGVAVVVVGVALSNPELKLLHPLRRIRPREGQNRAILST